MSRFVLVTLFCLAASLETVYPQQTKTRQASQQDAPLSAAVCGIDVDNKTIRVLPWDARAKEWKRDSLRDLAWDNQTQLSSSGNTLTMPQFIGGKPLDKDSTTVDAIQGERAVLHFKTVNGKAVVSKVEMMALFGGESFPAMVGNSGGFIVGGTKVSCGVGAGSRARRQSGIQLTVITSDGVTHEIQNVEITSERDLNLPSWGFSEEELDSLVVLTDAERPWEDPHWINREALQSMGQTYHALILPVSAIERIATTGTTIRNRESDYSPVRYYRPVSVTMRNGAVLRAITSQNSAHNWANSGAHEFLVKGTEDLHDFGKADFENRLGDGDINIKEIRFPPLAPTVVATKTALTAVITEVGGRVTRLSDLRLEGGNVLRFTRTGSTVKLVPSDVRKIELHRGIYGGSTYSVLLNSGAQQDFEWLTPAVVGKTPGGWYEWIPGAAIRTIDFAAAK
jgi:hypothetical protein